MVGENLSKSKKAGGVGGVGAALRPALGLQLEGGEEEDSPEDELDLGSSGRDQNAEESKAIANPTDNVGNERESM